MSGMKDKIKEIENFPKEVYDPQEDLKVMRWFIRRADYSRAEELMAEFEHKYQALMNTMGMEDIQCLFWQLKLEIMTQGFSLMAFSREEEKIITDIYRLLVRMDQLQVRAVRYLFQRQDYLRMQKKLDYMDAEEDLRKVAASGMGLLLVGAVVLSYIRVEWGTVTTSAVNIILCSTAIVYFLIMGMFAYFCKKAYSKWQSFCFRPVPFEDSDLF